MKRVCIIVFALAVLGLGGVVRAAEESPAHSGGDRPAMLNDIRNAENRINARIDGVETRMNARMDRMENRMEQMENRMDGRVESLRGDIRVIQNGLYAILASMAVGVVGVFLKERRSVGAPAMMALTLGMLVFAGIVLASG